MVHMSSACRLVPVEVLEPQAISNVLNAYARLEIEDMELVDHLCKATTRCRPEDLTAQGVANTVNALAKFGVRDDALLNHIAEVIVETLVPNSLSAPSKEAAWRHKGMGFRGFDPQAVANVANAYARLNFRHDDLFRELGTQALALPPEAWDHQALALVLNAYAKVCRN